MGFLLRYLVPVVLVVLAALVVFLAKWTVFEKDAAVAGAVAIVCIVGAVVCYVATAALETRRRGDGVAPSSSRPGAPGTETPKSGTVNTPADST